MRAVAASVAHTASRTTKQRFAIAVLQQMQIRSQASSASSSSSTAGKQSVAKAIVDNSVSKEFLGPLDQFAERHIGPSATEIAEMCELIGVEDVDDLMAQTIPADVRRYAKLNVPDGNLGEAGTLAWIKEILSQNVVAKNHIGQGYHGSLVPGVVLRNLLENPGWYTAYTPYQAEISQGRMESLINFQTMVAELTGMEIANASLLDEATAGAEAMAMVGRTVNAKVKNQFFVSKDAHSQTIAVMKQRAEYLGIELIVGDHETTEFGSMKNLAGALVQYPDTTGKLHDFTNLGSTLKKNGAHLVVAADPLALVAAKSPGEMGANIVVGSMQRFGVPMWFGGPSAAYLATSKKQVRRMPGRIIGESLDRLGNPAYRLTLQTREQHIRLDKATSNVCTAQVLLANMAAMYGVYHNTSGLKAIARRVHGLAQLFAFELGKLGVEVPSSVFFDGIAFEAPNSKELLKKLQDQGVNLRILNDGRLFANFDESHLESDVHKLFNMLQDAGVSGSAAAPSIVVDGKLPEAFARTSKFMEQSIFNTIHSETEMMRYMTSLQSKDLSLDRSMISLGSCTMKLNSVSSLTPCSWPEIANMHPFAPPSQTQGYIEMLESLETWLNSITGFDACSLQPTSGASGEYAGLLVIRKYLESKGEGHRNVCIIPKSAHGTNPASAVMCGMKIKWIDDSKGVDIDEFRQLCEIHKDDLAALMFTYPSTRAFFEDGITAMTEAVHKNGGQVYMDGANMNAQLGLTSPGIIGADVCHLNLHKTFSIPHGGGGPGLGPICCRSHLSPFLPGHNVLQPSSGGSLGPVSAAPYGQAGIAAIPWMFIAMLGANGVTDSARLAILNANYMKARLAPHYSIYASNSNDRCSHEFIINVADLRKESGIVEEDIAKRLQDYGFHAPTMSWPVPHSLMVEPTESEDKAELDRFCDAMVMIRDEIRKIEDGTWPRDDNPLKNAPHTQVEVCATEWTHPYTREEAVFPAPWVHQRGKFWPSVARVDNSLGDRKLKLCLAE